MISEFEEAAFGTDVGEICKPILTQYGYHIIKVTDKKEPVKIPFDHISQKLEETLRAERNQQALKKLITELMGKYPVTIY